MKRRSGLPPLLVVDDERNMLRSLELMMEDNGYGVCAVGSGEEGLEVLGGRECFMVLTDARLGGMSGYDFLREVKRGWPDLPVLIFTAHELSPRQAVEAIKAGAVDYLTKPFDPEELLHAVARCAERYGLIASLRRQVEGKFGLDRIVGECEGIRGLREQIRTVAPTDATVLIVGESGTGKELVAGAIHVLSSRLSHEYVRINCAAVAEALQESELFGHEKGSFTGAIRRKVGRVEDADGGTIFLDEIGDMGAPMQAKLLRFLEDGSFTRVGGNEELRVDVRLVAATNRDIGAEIKGNRFREDLFHRLNVIQLMLPPLRERGGDLLLLAEFFLEQFNVRMGKQVGGFSREAVRKLERYDWPGNVRELRNAVEHGVILETEGVIQAGSLPNMVRGRSGGRRGRGVSGSRRGR